MWMLWLAVMWLAPNLFALLFVWIAPNPNVFTALAGCGFGLLVSFAAFFALGK